MPSVLSKIDLTVTPSPLPFFPVVCGSKDSAAAHQPGAARGSVFLSPQHQRIESSPPPKALRWECASEKQSAATLGRARALSSASTSVFQLRDLGAPAKRFKMGFINWEERKVVWLSDAKRRGVPAVEPAPVKTRRTMKKMGAPIGREWLCADAEWRRAITLLQALFSVR